MAKINLSVIRSVCKLNKVGHWLMWNTTTSDSWQDQSFISVLGLLWCFVQVTELHRKLVLWLVDFLWCDSRLLVLWVSVLPPGRSVPMVHDGFCFTHWGGLLLLSWWLPCPGDQVELLINSLCGRMSETACDNELHCIDGWPGISLLPWKSRLHSDDKEMDLDLLSWATSSHRFWTQTQGRVMLFITPVYSQCCSFHAAFSSCWCNIK